MVFASKFELHEWIRVGNFPRWKEKFNVWIRKNVNSHEWDEKKRRIGKKIVRRRKKILDIFM